MKIFKSIKHWFDTGAPYIWLNAGAVSISIIMVVGLLLLIAVRGLGHFWPADVVQFDYYPEPEGASVLLMGEFFDEEIVPRKRVGKTGYAGDVIKRRLVKIGNRELVDLDFRWVLDAGIRNQTRPEDAVVVERLEWGNVYGFLTSINLNGKKLTDTKHLWETFQKTIEESRSALEEIEHIEKDLIGGINYNIERLRLKERRLELDNEKTPKNMRPIETERRVLWDEYNRLAATLEKRYAALNRSSFNIRTADGKTITVNFSKTVRAYRPNTMGISDKFGFYFVKLWEFLSDDPREANTEGGIFPAIFSTALMVMIMAVFVTPFGIIAAVYLREYATQGLVTRLVRISVNNLAGVPSVVYGVFGLGFFIYFLGGSIDALFFPESLPAPTFGTPGLLWSSLTLAILTVPVVIVTTEEGLARVPRDIREGSLALGATKAETLWRTVLPMTTSAMITGLILAVARAAGEVAPLMLVGVVKLAPSLAIDGNMPFLHLDRKFMHLGFHIYDVGFQSPNVEAARPLIYSTSLLLVLLIIVLNLTAIIIRNNLREKYHAAEQG